MRVGINGMGRIGRLALRAAMGGMFRAPDDPRADNPLDVVHVNELKGGAATTAHLLEFDSVHGRWRENFGALAQWGGMAACRWGSAAMLALCLAITFLLPGAASARRVPA
jgi:hypothetical protein